jgi:hypothetical protein
MNLRNLITLRMTSNALNMFQKAVKKLEASNSLAQKIISDNEKKVAKLKNEKEVFNEVIVKNQKVISNINSLLGS